MSYPQYFTSDYISPSGNPAASGYFKHYLTQNLANMYPYWNEIRDNESSVGQQYLSVSALTLGDINNKLSETLDEKFITIAPVDEIDVLTRMKIPSNISYLENPNIECWTAPSGATPSGTPFPTVVGANPDTNNAMRLTEINDLEEFYYNVIPTRLKAYDSELYSTERAEDIGIYFPSTASGIYDPYSKHIDKWKRQHDLEWAVNKEFSNTVAGRDGTDYDGYFDVNGSPDYHEVATEFTAKGGEIKGLWFYGELTNANYARYNISIRESINGEPGDIIQSKVLEITNTTGAEWIWIPLDIIANVNYGDKIFLSVKSWTDPGFTGDLDLYYKNVSGGNSYYKTSSGDWVSQAGREYLIYAPSNSTLHSDTFKKQDTITKEAYYSYDNPIGGEIKSLAFHRGKLHCICDKHDGINKFLGQKGEEPSTLYSTGSPPGGVKFGTNFLADASIAISRVYIYVKYFVSGTPTVFAEIREESSSSLGALLATSSPSYPVYDGPSPYGRWVTFNFPTPYNLAVGNTYAFNLFTTDTFTGVRTEYVSGTGNTSFFHNYFTSTFTTFSDRSFWIYADSDEVDYRTGETVLTLLNPHPEPTATELDELATFSIGDITAPLDPSGTIAPSGVDIDEEGHIWVLDEGRQNLYALDFMYDYFLVDKETRYIYFREDYSDPGVFVKPA